MECGQNNKQDNARLRLAIVCRPIISLRYARSWLLPRKSSGRVPLTGGEVPSTNAPTGKAPRIRRRHGGLFSFQEKLLQRHLAPQLPLVARRIGPEDVVWRPSLAEVRGVDVSPSLPALRAAAHPIDRAAEEPPRLHEAPEIPLAAGGIRSRLHGDGPVIAVLADDIHDLPHRRIALAGGEVVIMVEPG